MRSCQIYNSTGTHALGNSHNSYMSPLNFICMSCLVELAEVQQLGNQQSTRTFPLILLAWISSQDCQPHAQKEFENARIRKSDSRTFHLHASFLAKSKFPGQRRELFRSFSFFSFQIWSVALSISEHFEVPTYSRFLSHPLFSPLSPSHTFLISDSHNIAKWQHHHWSFSFICIVTPRQFPPRFFPHQRCIQLIYSILHFAADIWFPKICQQLYAQSTRLLSSVLSFLFCTLIFTVIAIAVSFSVTAHYNPSIWLDRLISWLLSTPAKASLVITSHLDKALPQLSETLFLFFLASPSVFLCLSARYLSGSLSRNYTLHDFLRQSHIFSQVATKGETTKTKRNRSKSICRARQQSRKTILAVRSTTNIV